MRAHSVCPDVRGPFLAPAGSLASPAPEEVVYFTVPSGITMAVPPDFLEFHTCDPRIPSFLRWLAWMSLFSSLGLDQSFRAALLVRRCLAQYNIESFKVPSPSKSLISARPIFPLPSNPPAMEEPTDIAAELRSMDSDDYLLDTLAPNWQIVSMPSISWLYFVSKDSNCGV